jgi:hypothetical protein
MTIAVIVAVLHAVSALRTTLSGSRTETIAAANISTTLSLPGSLAVAGASVFPLTPPDWMTTPPRVRDPPRAAPISLQLIIHPLHP